MAVKIYDAAKERLIGVWDYTEQMWGEEQADRYVRGLVEAIHAAVGKRHRWRRLMDEALKGVFFIRFQHHYVFFENSRMERWESLAFFTRRWTFLHD